MKFIFALGLLLRCLPHTHVHAAQEPEINPKNLHHAQRQQQRVAVKPGKPSQIRSSGTQPLHFLVRALLLCSVVPPSASAENWKPAFSREEIIADLDGKTLDGFSDLNSVAFDTCVDQDLEATDFSRYGFQFSSEIPIWRMNRLKADDMKDWRYSSLLEVWLMRQDALFSNCHDTHGQYSQECEAGLSRIEKIKEELTSISIREGYSPAHARKKVEADLASFRDTFPRTNLERENRKEHERYFANQPKHQKRAGRGGR